MHFRFLRLAVVVSVAVVALAAFFALAPRAGRPTEAPSSRLDRVVVLVLETYRSDTVDPEAIESNLFLTKLAAQNRVAVNYYGVWKPSLPNYLAMISGDVFDVGENFASCFSPDHPKECYAFDAPNLVDQLETAHIAWEGLFDSMPTAGFLGVSYPEDAKLYVQKHNPFVYFKSIALNAARLAKIKPFVLSELQASLADPVSAPRFIFLVPNLCNDQHGTVGCKPAAVTLAAGNAFLAETVPAIINAPAFTERSVLFITWDNSTGNGACCGAWRGGGRVPLIAVTKHPLTVRGTIPSNHYSMLATIEDGFGLPRIANAKGASTLFELLPDFTEKRTSQTSGAEDPTSSTP